ncbi:hypothetical protein GCM10009828_058350 [Actinoplanes couchii]|uniref:Uncharacterized protein n=1 Tax=Actinoplanes couchii TaxID=403638 RepID=A0ABQ3XTC1_9ACTN|nr:hypothetical protein Aco03nite_100840 [Actinoplanes couchii]
MLNAGRPAGPGYAGTPSRHAQVPVPVQRAVAHLEREPFTRGHSPRRTVCGAEQLFHNEETATGQQLLSGDIHKERTVADLPHEDKRRASADTLKGDSAVTPASEG